MTPTVRGLLVRAAIIAAIGAWLGFGGVLDPIHAALLGCLGIAAVLLRSGPPDQPDTDWPTRRFTNRAGGRNAVSDLAWQVFDSDQRVRRQVVQRVRELATARLAALGVDADDPGQWAEVARLLGPRVASGLASDRRPTARTLQTWLDAIDRLNHERTLR
ncbi:MAG: hypothetical protein KIT69_12465 [Propionibacteriaceae bacterium]|nr:hypothetical protein [Propionibacteriaceae bacterium]